MKILDIKALRGSNYWSYLHKQLIVLTIDEGDTAPETRTALFAKNLKKTFPSIHKQKREFFHKIKEGVPVAEIIAQVVIELQSLARISCEYSATDKVAGTNISNIVFSYSVEEVGIYAAETAFRIVSILAEGEPYRSVRYDVADLIHYKTRYAAGPTSDYLLEEIKRRGIPYKKFNMGSLITAGHGINQKKIRTAITNNTSGLGMEIASDKEETKKMLAEAHVPVPKGILVSSEREFRERITEVSFPLVVKPLDGNHGRGITTDINSLQDALFGFVMASKISRTVIVEEFITGEDYRFLVVDYKLAAATKRTPAFVTGDGVSTVQRLIQKENQNPQRGEGAEYVLALIKIDAITKRILKNKKLTLKSILPVGERLILKETANISSGGIATDVTDIVHPENIFLAERIARMFNLDICGIDIVAKAVDVPFIGNQRGGAVVEVNAGPGLRMHSNPQIGSSRNVAARIVDMLHPDTNSAIIPIVAVSDFNDAPLCIRLISHIAMENGLKPGCNTSKGTYIQKYLSCKGKCTDYEHVQEVLFDPTINYAVVECSDETILNAGLPFNNCRICIISEVDSAPDKYPHLSGNGMDLKRVLVQSVIPEGYLILNADDASVYDLREQAKCNIAMFSTDSNNSRIKKHHKDGGIGATMNNDGIFIYHDHKKVPVVQSQTLPLLFQDPHLSAKYILPAILSAFVSNIPLFSIKQSLASFSFPSKEKKVLTE